jgi:hypothetical protein
MRVKDAIPSHCRINSMISSSKCWNKVMFATMVAEEVDVAIRKSGRTHARVDAVEAAQGRIGT